jgi:hypothetical protein
MLAQLFARNAAIAEFPSVSEGMVALIAISHAGYLGSKTVPHSAQ